MASVKTISVFLLVLCAACGGNKLGPASEPAKESAPPAAAAAPEKTAAPDNRPAIVVFGDSLSAGFGADPGQSFPDFLQKKLDRLGYRYRVVNQGISGDTTSGGTSRVGEALAEKPDVVILELGGNDGLRGVPLANIRGNLDRMLTTFQKAGVRVLLAGITLPPNYGPDYIKPFDSMYRELASAHHVPLIPFLLQDVALKGNGLMQPDGIHPTAKGNEIVAQTVLKALEPLLKK
jgi:acyl-CoA thioesterase-1